MDFNMTDEKFLATVLHECRHSYNGHNPYKDPPFDLILSTFKTTARHFDINSQMENRCFQALLLFTADTSLVWKSKIEKLSRYFLHPVVRLQDQTSPTFDFVTRENKQTENMPDSPDITSFKPPRIMNSTFPMSLTSTNDLAEGHFLSTLLNSSDFDSQLRTQSPPSKLASMYELHFNVPPANPAHLETPAKKSLANAAGNKPSSSSSSPPFSVLKGHETSLSPIPLHLSSPLKWTGYSTVQGSSTDRFVSSGSGINTGRFISSANSTSPDMVNTGRYESTGSKGDIASLSIGAGAGEGTSPYKPSVSILLADKQWIHRRLHNAICRLLWNRYKRRGKAAGKRINTDALTTGLSARAQIRRLRKLSSLSGSTGNTTSSSSGSVSPVRSHSPRHTAVLPSESSMPFPDTAYDGADMSSNSAGRLEVHDPIPTPSTIRLLALFQRFLADKPLGSFAYGAYRHPAPSLLLHLSKLSVKYRVDGDQEKWLRARVYDFLQMETMDLCFRIWTAEIYIINQAKAFFVSLSLRRGFEGLQDFALVREGPRRGVFCNKGTLHFCRRAAKQALLKLSQTSKKAMRSRQANITADGHLGDVLTFKIFHKWKYDSVKRFRVERMMNRSSLNRQTMRCSLLRILFQRFQDRVRLYPVAHAVAIRRIRALRRKVLWGWINAFIVSASCKGRVVTKSIQEVMVDLPTDTVIGKECFVKWKLMMWRGQVQDTVNCKAGILHCQKQRKRVAIGRWIHFYKLERKYRSSKPIGGPIIVRNPINTSMLSYFHRWRRTLFRNRQVMMYILKQPKRVRMLHGYPVNNGHMLSGCQGLNGHVSLSAKAYHKIWAASIGIGTHGESSVVTDICLVSGIRRFRTRSLSLVNQRRVDRNGYLYGLRKKFNIFCRTLRCTIAHRYIINTRLRKVLTHFKAAYVASVMTTRLLKRTLLCMRKYSSLREPLRRRYIRFVTPPLLQSFHRIKAYALHCAHAASIVAVRRMYWLSKLCIENWITLRKADATRRRMTQRVAMCNYFKKQQKYRKLEKRCVMWRQFGRLVRLVLDRVLSHKVGADHYRTTHCMESLHTLRVWVSYNRRNNSARGRAVVLWKALASRRALSVMSQYVSKSKLVRDNTYYARLFVALWRLIGKINARFQQLRLLYISEKYHETHAKRHCLKRWMREMKHSQKLRFDRRVARKYYRHRKQSFALILLHSIAQGS